MANRFLSQCWSHTGGRQQQVKGVRKQPDVSEMCLRCSLRKQPAFVLSYSGQAARTPLFTLSGLLQGCVVLGTPAVTLPVGVVLPRAQGMGV